MVSHHDYRLEHMVQAGVYFSPLGFDAEHNLEKCFQHFAEKHTVSVEDIELYGRSIPIRKRAGKSIWFDFENICGVPRSQKDYLALAEQYENFFISNIPIIQKNQNNLITSFINLVDILYDARLRLVISAATHAEALYPEGLLRFEFARTQSRLIEMQSMDYFSRK